jgi:hypothetical protein
LLYPALHLHQVSVSNRSTSASIGHGQKRNCRYNSPSEQNSPAAFAFSKLPNSSRWMRNLPAPSPAPISHPLHARIGSSFGFGSQLPCQTVFQPFIVALTQVGCPPRMPLRLFEYDFFRFLVVASLFTAS